MMILAFFLAVPVTLSAGSPPEQRESLTVSGSEQALRFGGDRRRGGCDATEHLRGGGTLSIFRAPDDGGGSE